MAAPEEARELGLGMADGIICATAPRHAARIVTLDADLASVPGAVVVE